MQPDTIWVVLVFSMCTDLEESSLQFELDFGVALALNCLDVLISWDCTSMPERNYFYIDCLPQTCP
jgi:hypothetical protein